MEKKLVHDLEYVLQEARLLTNEDIKYMNVVNAAKFMQVICKVAVGDLTYSELTQGNWALIYEALSLAAVVRPLEVLKKYINLPCGFKVCDKILSECNKIICPRLKSDRRTKKEIKKVLGLKDGTEIFKEKAS